MPKKRQIVVEFDSSVVDAKAFARAVYAMAKASPMELDGITVDGFSMNKTDGWHVGEYDITVTPRQ
ncbi:hypothetical protein ACX8Z9_04630 [Arthrobacter halodurans]|uniref:Uncharacterized protein n=1 Tax=Arthrobacter halodurans TaxID=516699 RepID=A0ABV4URZ1_9MICC